MKVRFLAKIKKFTAFLTVFLYFGAYSVGCATPKEETEEDWSPDYSFGPSKPYKDRYFKKGNHQRFD